MMKHTLNYLILIFLLSTSCNSENKHLHVVTVEEFEIFVNETSYETDAERYGWSIVQKDILNFEVQEDATWRKPDGKNISQEGYPVTQVSFNDAMAYCKWANKRLPSYQEYWKLVENDVREKAINISDFFRADEINVVGNVWEITSTEIGNQVRLAGGSIFCDVKTCNGSSPDRELYVDKETGNIHIGFSIILK